MAGEVLGAAQHPCPMQTAHKGGRQGSGPGGVLAPGPHVDHRIGGVVVHIAHRPQHPVEPYGPGIPAAALPVSLCQGDSPIGITAVQPPQGQRRDQPAGPLEALAHPLLHVGAEKQGLVCPPLQLSGAQGQFRRTAPQQNHPPHAGRQQLLQLAVWELPLGVAPLVIGQQATGPHHHQAGDQTAQGSISCRCRHASGSGPSLPGPGSPLRLRSPSS